MDQAESPKRERKLTPKQERFCQLYTTYWEATRAAREAGYSEKSAYVQGYQLLQIPLVKSRIAELRDHALEQIGCTRERLLLELTRLAYLDPNKALDDLGQPKQIKEIDEDTRRCISEIEIYERFEGRGEEKHVTGLVKNVKFAPKKGALDSLAKVLGYAPDKIEHSGPNGKPIEHKNIGDLPDEQLDARIAAYLAKANPPKEEE